jgi:hypothetical protein
LELLYFLSIFQASQNKAHISAKLLCAKPRKLQNIVIVRRRAFLAVVEMFKLGYSVKRR